MKSIIAALTVAFVCLLASCSPKTESTETATQKPEAAKPAETEKAPPPPTEMLSASHILVMYAGAQRAPDEIKRTKDEAKALAEEIHKKVLAGEDFAELAKQYSDCPSKSMGGDLGTFASNRMTPAFTKALEALKVDEISGPVETPFGYHLIKRQEVVKPEKLSASFIVILHAESQPNPMKITRTKEEAQKLANEAMEKIKAGEDFGEVAKQYSDHPNKIAGGNMGNFESDRVPPEYAEAVKSLKIGEVSPEPLETKLGFHIFKRQELIKSELLSASVIVIAHKDSTVNPTKATRTKEEALARANEVIEKLKAGAKFEDMVTEYSDHPNKSKGGDLGTFLSDRMVQHISDEVRSLEIGDFSKKPLETPAGYHIFYRKTVDPAIEQKMLQSGKGAAN